MVSRCGRDRRGVFIRACGPDGEGAERRENDRARAMGGAWAAAGAFGARRFGGVRAWRGRARDAAGRLGHRAQIELGLATRSKARSPARLKCLGKWPRAGRRSWWSSSGAQVRAAEDEAAELFESNNFLSTQANNFNTLPAHVANSSSGVCVNAMSAVTTCAWHMATRCSAASGSSARHTSIWSRGLGVASSPPSTCDRQRERGVVVRRG